MSKEWLNNIKISQELKDKIYYDEKNDLWVISWNAVGEALERAKKVEELLGLYRSKDMHMEDYYTYGSLRGSQKALDNLRSVREEIEVLEKELEK